MIVTYYPDQPRETRHIGFDERNLLIARIKSQKQFRKAGIVMLAASLILVAVSLIL